MGGMRPETCEDLSPPRWMIEAESYLITQCSGTGYSRFGFRRRLTEAVQAEASNATNGTFFEMVIQQVHSQCGTAKVTTIQRDSTGDILLSHVHSSEVMTLACVEALNNKTNQEMNNAFKEHGHTGPSLAGHAHCTHHQVEGNNCSFSLAKAARNTTNVATDVTTTERPTVATTERAKKTVALTVASAIVAALPCSSLVVAGLLLA